MSSKGRGGFAGFKGADLLAKLREAMTEPPPTPVTQAEPKLRTDGRSPTVEEELLAAAARRGTRNSRRAGSRAADSKRPPAKQPPPEGITVLRFRNRQQRELALAAAARAVPAAPEAMSSGPSIDFGEEAFRKSGPFRQALEGFAADHRAAQVCSNVDAEVAAQRLRSGADASSRIVDSDDGYFLGYDFGTSTTKVVARYPYGGIDEAFAIDVPASLCSGEQAHLMPTAIWYCPDTGSFSLTPRSGWRLLDSFKSALLQGRGHRICKGSGLTVLEASTAFLAMHFAYTIGTALEQAPEFRLASINVGVPVAALGEAANIRLFELAIEAATGLVKEAETLTIERVRERLSRQEPPVLPYTRHAELSGAIAGYCAAPRFYVGGHMIIDCGSATLDMATFDLDQRSNRPIGIYSAMVENLGADACDAFVRHGLGVETCRKAARHQEHLVFRETLRRRPGMFAQEDGKYPYQIILVGGGIHSRTHAPLLKRMAEAFASGFHRPAVAPALRYDDRCEPGRLILADGLARDPIELKEVALPAGPALPIAREVQSIGPEQV